MVHSGAPSTMDLQELATWAVKNELFLIFPLLKHIGLHPSLLFLCGHNSI